MDRIATLRWREPASVFPSNRLVQQAARTLRPRTAERPLTENLSSDEGRRASRSIEPAEAQGEARGKSAQPLWGAETRSRPRIGLICGEIVFVHPTSAWT